MTQASKVRQFTIDIDQSDAQVLDNLAQVVNAVRDEVELEGVLTLELTLLKSGEIDRKILYTLNRERFVEADRDSVFPKVVEEVLKREFPGGVSRNEQLVAHVTKELQKDPYWSGQVIDLLYALRSIKK